MNKKEKAVVKEAAGILGRIKSEKKRISSAKNAKLATKIRMAKKK